MELLRLLHSKNKYYIIEWQSMLKTVVTTVIRALTGAVQYTKIMSRPDVGTVPAYVPFGHMCCPEVCTVPADLACLAVTD